MGYALVVARNGANDVSDPPIFSWWLISESISTIWEPGRNQLWTKLRYKSLDLWKILRGVSQSIRPGALSQLACCPGSVDNVIFQERFSNCFVRSLLEGVHFLSLVSHDCLCFAAACIVGHVALQVRHTIRYGTALRKFFL